MQDRQRTWVIGDVHGAAKALEQCLERANVDIERDKIIQLGDVTDGYPEVYECVELLIGIKNLIAIKGNHDDWFHDFITTDQHPWYWEQGGVGTLESYLSHAGKPGALVSADIPTTHRQFFLRQHLYHIDEKGRCFIHAGFIRGIPFDKQDPRDFFWDRTLWQNAYQHRLLTADDRQLGEFGPVSEFSEVFLGHTPTINWNSEKPLNAFNIWNLDTGAGHGAKLTIMDADSKEYWQSDPTTCLYPKSYR